MVQLLCSAAMMTVTVFYMDLVIKNFIEIQSYVLSVQLVNIIDQLNLQQTQHPSLEALILLISASISMLNLLLYCFFGRLATESYMKMSECMYEMKWYRLPNRLQKYFILIIGDMSRPLFYHGFGVTNLSLETFQNLLGKVVTYYLAIKTIASK